jgi:tetratricopeptide (TPR) repeat protein
MSRTAALLIVVSTALAPSHVGAQDEPAAANGGESDAEAAAGEVAPESPAEAEEPTAEPAPDPRALFAEGALAYAAGRYADAIEHFEAAFALREDPALLFDLGLAHERLGHDAEAVAMYERYLEARPEAENRAHVRRRIGAARSRIEAADADPYAGPIALGVIAAVSFVAAGAFWLVGDAQYAELEDTCAARGCTAREIDESSVRTWDLGTNLGLGVGALAALAAGVLLITRRSDEGDEESEAEAAASLRIGPTSIELRGAL